MGRHLLNKTNKSAASVRKPIKAPTVFINEVARIAGHIEAQVDTKVSLPNQQPSRRSEELARIFKKNLKHMEKAYIEYQIAADRALDMLNSLPISERVKLLFDRWAERDKYGRAMRHHTRAIERAISRIPDNLLSASLLEESRNTKRKRKSLVFFDPFVGNGDVLSIILRIAAEQHVRISQKPLDLVIYINDISPRMVRLARMKLEKQKKILENEHNARIKNIFSFEINFLDDAARDYAFSSLPHSGVDVVIVSQTLDLLKGIETKNKALTLLHDYLKVGGNLVVIGEDPDRFTLSNDMDILSTLLFESVFEPFGKNETEAEIKRIRNGRLIIIGESSEKIDDFHSTFVRVAQRIHRPSELGKTQMIEPAADESNGKSANGQKDNGKPGV